jgi:hypothetical protein
MADAGATLKREVPEEKLYAGFTEAEKKFLLDLGGFLAKYPKFAGDTPFKDAIAARFQVRVNVSGNVGANTCRNICYIGHRPMCCDPWFKAE